MPTHPLRTTLPSPHTNQIKPRFLVASQTSTSADLKLYAYDRDKARLGLEGFVNDLGQLRALAWSPHPSHHQLVAAGLSTGKTLLLNLTPSTLSPSTTSSTSSSPSSQLAILPVRHSRPVTALSCSTLDPNYLASGLERHRSDYSLLIWDVASATISLSTDDASGVSWQRGEDRLEAFAVHTRSTPGELRNIQHYCPSEHIHSVSFLPSSISQLLASANNKFIRLFDLRSPNRDNSGSITWQTRAVYDITPHPTRIGLFASHQHGTRTGGTGIGNDREKEGGVVKLWDMRKSGEAIMSLDVGGGGVLGLKWIGDGLGVGCRDGGVGVWDVVHGSGWSGVGEGEEMITLGGFRQVVKPKQSITSFAFSHPLPQRERDVLFVLKDGTIAVGPVTSAPVLSSSSKGEQLLALRSLRNVQGSTEQGHHDDHQGSIQQNRFQLPSEHIPESAKQSSTEPNMPTDVDDNGEMSWEGWERVIGGDIGVVIRKRAEEGYGLGDMLHNATVASRYPGRDRLAGVWEFAEHLTSVMSAEASRARIYDLTHAGICSLWTGQHLTPPSQTSPSLPYRSQSALTRRDIDPEYLAVVNEINGMRMQTGQWAKPGSSKLPYGQRDGIRRMILGICGEELEGEIDRLIDHDQRTKAACWAYFASEPDRAVSILLNSPNSDHRLLATTLAAFLSSSSASTNRGSYFNESWRAMVHRVEDPYVRLMLWRISGEGWESVLGEEGVPILDSLGLPSATFLIRSFTLIMCTQLTAFLSERDKIASRNSDLHDLPLTGLSGPALPLLQRWLDRTGDMQTTALLSAFIPTTNLRKSDKELIKRWQEGYRDLLDSWGMWGTRVEFDTSLREERRRRGEDEKAPGQGDDVGSCPVCNATLTKKEEERLGRKLEVSNGHSWPSERVNACKVCAQVLPRCCICLSLVVAHQPLRDKLQDELDQAYVCCLTCRHGGHANHFLSWFEGGLEGEIGHDKCPVAGCGCRCGSI